MVNSPAAHGKRWFNSTCQSHDLLEAILAAQIKQGGHSDAEVILVRVLMNLMAGSSSLKTT